MKADERVSDEAAAIADRLLYELPILDDIQCEEFELMKEIIEKSLQSRRAAEQATLPAVEEMAEKITRIAYRHAQDGPYDKVPGEDLKDCQRKIAPLLTTLYAKLAKASQTIEGLDEATTEQFEKLAEYAEVLGEARSKLAGNGECSASCDECRDEREKTIARIDALLGAKGET